MLKKENFSLVNRMIKINKMNFPIKIKDADVINDVYFYFKYHNWIEKKGTVQELKDLLKNAQQKTLLNKLSFMLQFDKELCQEENIHQIINDKLRPKDLQLLDIKYYSFITLEELKPVSLLEYTLDKYLSTGKVFGDNDLNSSR